MVLLLGFDVVGAPAVEGVIVEFSNAFRSKKTASFSDLDSNWFCSSRTLNILPSLVMAGS